jgi:hypothetical protein
MRGPRGVWKGALGGPQQVPQVAPSEPLGASVGGLSGPIANLREPYQGLYVSIRSMRPLGELYRAPWDL